MTMFPIWKTITLGLHRDVLAYSAALDKVGCKRENIIPQFRKNDEFQPGEVDLVKISACELGLHYERHLYEDACSEGVKRGLELCTMEIGLALRLAHAAQPDKPYEILVIAMKPGTYKDPRVEFTYGSAFYVLYHDQDSLFLGGREPSSNYRGSYRDEYIFVRPRR